MDKIQQKYYLNSIKKMNNQKSLKLHEAYTARSRESLRQLVSHSFDDKYSKCCFSYGDKIMST